MNEPSKHKMTAAEKNEAKWALAFIARPSSV